jgi:hypothetical protein
MLSLLWIIHENAYWMPANSVAVLPVCSQRSQRTETTVHALIDCQSVRPFWGNIFRLISGQVDPMPDVDAILQLHLPTDMHIHRFTKLILLAFTCGLWVVYCARIRRIYTDVSPLVHSLIVEWHSTVKEIANAKQRTAIIHGDLVRFLPI